MEQNKTRDGNLHSIWQNIPKTMFATGLLTECDVLIAGGGITGITTGLLLQQEGKQCIIAEAHEIGFGTTGGTTCHINTLLDTPYTTIEDNFGEEGARLIADAAVQARGLIAGLVAEHGIACSFEYKDGYLYAQTGEEEQDLNRIYEASRKAGVDVEYVDTIPVPVPFKKALCFRQQAQMHPLKYLDALAHAFVAKGGVIAEHVRVMKHEESDDGYLVHTSAGIIKAKQVIYATHIPQGINLSHFRCAPYRSYVLGVQLSDGIYPYGMAYDMKDPYHYFRTHVVDGITWLIAGGADHKTGHGDPGEAFDELETFVRKYFEVQSVDYKWSSQYFEPADGLPYIGRLTAGEDVFIATGYSGNGIIFGTLSGIIFRDLLNGYNNPLAELLSPGRLKAAASFTNIVKENADVVYHFFSDRLSLESLPALDGIKPGTVKVVIHENEKLAVYRADNGILHIMSPVCTHAGCFVTWNNEEKSWDCPCHGGRYDALGKVVTGPARKDLKRIEHT